jgi:hypothetical protein
MAKGRLTRGGSFMERLPEYEHTLYILYGIGVVILIILIYIVFFRTTITPAPSQQETASTSSPTTNPTKSISSKVGAKITNLKQKINNSLDDVQVIAVIKGKLEDWGDDINKLPADVKEKAIACYKNVDGCVF